LLKRMVRTEGATIEVGSIDRGRGGEVDSITLIRRLYDKGSAERKNGALMADTRRRILGLFVAIN